MRRSGCRTPSGFMLSLSAHRGTGLMEHRPRLFAFSQTTFYNIAPLRVLALLRGASTVWI